MDRQERLNATFESVKATMVTSFDEVYKLSRDTARLRKSTTEGPITPAQEEEFRRLEKEAKRIEPHLEILKPLLGLNLGLSREESPDDPFAINSVSPDDSSSKSESEDDSDPDLDARINARTQLEFMRMVGALYGSPKDPEQVVRDFQRHNRSLEEDLKKQREREESKK